MKAPSFVTFTGLDELSALGDVKFLSDRYPIEWGILLSASREGVENRYPDLKARKTFYAKGLNLAGHLCGAWAKAVAECSVAGKSQIPNLDSFARVQVNVNRLVSPTWSVGLFGIEQKRRCILQHRSGPWPDNTNLDWLYDVSGGRGEAPTAWPAYPGRFVGYAGGIGPDNAAEVVASIDASGPYWLDMESRIRTDDWLDLDKCEDVCKAVFG